ncbi:predicted protein [Streptomyces sp. AA4]|nr:predicted protein [Streptomyces sp. AA4]
MLALPRPDRRDALETLVSAEFRRALLMSEKDDLPPDENYFALGLTSLRAAEIKQRLEEKLGCELDASLLFDNATVRQVVDFVAEAVLPGAGAPAAAEPSGPGHRQLVDSLLEDLYEH